MKKEKQEIKEVSSEKNETRNIKEGGEMKKQIITLIIGILIGAVITASVFLIVKPKNDRKIPDFSQFEKNGERTRPSNGENFEFDKEGRARKRSDSSDKSKVDDNSKTEDSKDESKA